MNLWSTLEELLTCYVVHEIIILCATTIANTHKSLQVVKTFLSWTPINSVTVLGNFGIKSHHRNQ